MSPVPVNPRRVFGVDFSAARDAGRHLWVCRAHPGAGGIRVESVEPLHELPGGAVQREPAFGALVQKVVESPRSAWGLDFCFSLPQAACAALAPGDQAGRWARVLDAVARLGDPEVLRQACREAGHGVEARRRTDELASTPFAPCNLRIYKQTYHGMSAVLLPLRGCPEVAVLPFDRLPSGVAPEKLPFNRPASGRAPHVYLMEVCPSSVLAALDYPRRGYKGPGDEEVGRRREILRRLTDDGLLRPPARGIRTRITEDPDGDALDALLAAVGAWRGYRLHDHDALHDDPAFGTEGFVYA